MHKMVSWTLLCSGLALLQATAIQAVLIPAGLPDGLYSISFDANGTATSEPVLLRAAHDPSSAIVRRQRGGGGKNRGGGGGGNNNNNPPPLPSTQSKCGGGPNLDIVQFATAKARLQEECDKGKMYPRGQAIFFTEGRAMAYFCNYDAENRCWRREVEEAMAQIVAKCGLAKGGEIYVPQYDKSYGGDNARDPKDVCTF